MPRLTQSHQKVLTRIFSDTRQVVSFHFCSFVFSFSIAPIHMFYFQKS